MVKALLSVKPEYAEKILSGEKIYEFRRRIFKREDVDILVIYATGPQCGVVAEARIGGIMESTPEDIWKRTNRHGGISHDRFMDSHDVADDATCWNVRRMVQRSCRFLDAFGPVVWEGFTFEGGYTPVVSYGDGDFLTGDTLWDEDAASVADQRPYAAVAVLLAYGIAFDPPRVSSDSLDRVLQSTVGCRVPVVRGVVAMAGAATGVRACHRI